MNLILQRIQEQQQQVLAWLDHHEATQELPLYTSVDVRDAGFKVAVVDTNLYPAGFNNLCEHGIEDAAQALREVIARHVQGCRNVLVIAEEHTRNTWYLEHLRILEQIIQKAGFSVRIATFLNVQPAVCENAKYVELETAAGHSIKIYCLKRLMERFEQGGMQPCFVIMNNDLTGGIPEVLHAIKTPIYPSIKAGWHARLKSHHFSHTADLIHEFAQLVDLDPWLFSCHYDVVDRVDINQEVDRRRLAQAAQTVIDRVQAKYTEHGIQDKPFVFLKADSGTYGMGVMPIEAPQQIRTLNRKDRNKLYKGKGAQVISRYLVQEGVPSSHHLADGAAEVCIYQIANHFVGGFFRAHAQKTSRENLNAKGMTFTKMCPHKERFADCGVKHDAHQFTVYRILARIAAIAAHREIQQLESVAPL